MDQETVGEGSKRWVCAVEGTADGECEHETLIVSRDGFIPVA
jgi:hypothetical protein